MELNYFAVIILLCLDANSFNMCLLAIDSEVVDCGPLTNPDNGQVNTSNGTTFGSLATYTCDTGYTLSGSESRTCEDSGVWAVLTSPICESEFTNTVTVMNIMHSNFNKYCADSILYYRSFHSNSV